MSGMDEFYRDFVNPFFKSRGFKRKGRTFRRVENNGDTAVVHFQASIGSMPGEYAFYINVGISHAPWFNYANTVRIRQGGKAIPEPEVMGSAYHCRVSPPEGYTWIVTNAGAATTWWSLEPILADAVSLTLRLLDRTEFLDYVDRGGRYVFPTKAILNAILRADSANDEEMKRLAANAREDDPVDFDAWLSQYRGKRQTRL